MAGLNVSESNNSDAFKVLQKIAYLDIHGLSGAGLIRLESGESPKVLRDDNAIIDAVKGLGKPINDMRSVLLETYQRESNAHVFKQMERDIMADATQEQVLKSTGPKLG